MAKKTDEEKKKISERKLKILEFRPKEEEKPDDFGDVLFEIINAGENEDEGRFHSISYSPKGVVIAWDEENDMLHAHVHNLTNMEMNYLLQRMIINIHVELY